MTPPSRRHPNGDIRTGPLAALDEVDGSPAQARRAERVPVREPHGGPGEAEHDQGDEQQAELLQHAVGGRSGGRRLTRRGRHDGDWRGLRTKKN